MEFDWFHQLNERVGAQRTRFRKFFLRPIMSHHPKARSALGLLRSFAAFNGHVEIALTESALAFQQRQNDAEDYST
jgi:hypothetical protein